MPCLFCKIAAGEIPAAGARIERTPAEQHPSTLVEADRLGARNGVPVADVTAGRAFGPVLHLLDSLAADGTEAPGVECTHGGTMHDQPEPTEEEHEA